MKNRSLYLILVLFIGCKVGHEKSSDEKITEIRHQLEQTDNEDGYSGTVLIAKDEEILLEKAYGFANLAHKVANKTNTKFGIASMGKMFTAVAIMQFREQGKLDMDTTIGEILPDYPNEVVKDSVTIHQLLVHTSGLTDFFNDEFEYRAKHTVRTIEDYFSLFKDDALAFSPGSQFSYSNAGYVVLGLIIQELSGNNYYDYVNQNIFIPAGMKNTAFYETDSSIDNLAQGYIKKDENGVWKTSVYMKGAKGSSAGGAYSTTNDLFNFAKALKNNILISKESLAFMTSEKNENNYGYGFSLNKFNDVKVYGHNGGAHGVSAELDIYKDYDYVVVTLSNRGSLDGWVDVRSMIRKTLAGSTDETDKFLGSKELIEIYKNEGYEAALAKLGTLKGKVSERYLMDEANKYRESKEYDKAIGLLNILAKGIPDSWFCFSVLADTHLDAGNEKLAISNYNESLKLEPKNTWAIEKLALLEKP